MKALFLPPIFFSKFLSFSVTASPEHATTQVTKMIARMKSRNTSHLSFLVSF